MMGYSKLCLLLLLSTYTLALASRFKTYKKYVYQYTTESRNSPVGTGKLKNGLQVSCQVEIEVPQMCRFVMHTRDCALSEFDVMDSQGQPVYTQNPRSDEFQAAMEKDNGILSEVTQNLSFQSAKKINNKVFDVNPSQSKPLHFEDSDDKAPVQTKDMAQSTLQELVALAGTDQGQKRTSLFHKLVSSLRVLRNKTLSQTVTEMLDVSGWLTWQALLQCGTTECTSAIFQAIRTIDGLTPEVDALVYGLSLQANPDATRVRDMLTMAQYKQNRVIMYALANTVKNMDVVILDVVTQVRNIFMEIFQDAQSPVEKRVATYLILMKNPDQGLLRDILKELENELMLETTLKAFNVNYDIFEVGIDGTGFEPTIDALFGEEGFFPDSISKVMYWADDKARMLREVLDRIAPKRDKTKRQVPQDLLKDITKNVQKLMNDVRFSPAPEAIAYLRLLGAEIGYMKTSDMRKMSETLFMYYNVFIRVLPAKSDLSFKPSVGLEFITEMGVHISDYVEAGLEIHTNMYHESSLNAKATMSRNLMRLSIPAPKSKTQLFTIRFAVEIQPTGDVSEYTATITNEMLREGKKGRHKVDSLKLTLRAEGDDLSEVTASLKYNRNKNTLTTEVVIPEFNVEAGIKLAVTDSDTKGPRMKGITVDVTNKNIPQLTIVGNARFDKMKGSMLQLQMVIPSLKTDVAVTTTLKMDENVIMDLDTVINLPETSYQQKASLKYSYCLP
ncbi:Apolipoprotein B-100 [Liparis tanakae]|uniref:Apolipoprotein B-100 n=1 Tax=Liparis tanakae TaxID=230148 RepID=A0A4Z2J458_9TELE|nr:Apolipoprotein B-100 [Liparis tanakae]